MDFNEKDVFKRMSKSIFDRYSKMDGGIEGNLTEYTEEMIKAGTVLGMESFLDFMKSDRCLVNTKEEIEFILQENINMLAIIYKAEKNQWRDFQWIEKRLKVN